MMHKSSAFLMALILVGSVVLAVNIQPVKTESGSWITTGSLNVERSYHTATLLDNGKALVVGGLVSSSGGTNSCELYDSSTRHWTMTGFLNQQRFGHTATLLNDGRVLVVGGMIGEPYGGIASRVELYDPATGAWSLASSINIPRFWHTATLLPGGAVLIAGGDRGGGRVLQCELYDPITNTWSITGSLQVGRTHAASVLLPTGLVLIAGGETWPDLSEGDVCELYDPSTGTWRFTGFMNEGRRWFENADVLLQNGKFLVAGGARAGAEGGLASCELYDWMTETWSFTGSLHSEQWGHTATLLLNGRVLLRGHGYTSELYNPDTGIWIETGWPIYTREYHTATLLTNGDVLAAGGFTRTCELFRTPTTSISEIKAFYTLDSFFLGNMTGLVPPNQYFVKGNNIVAVEFSIYVNGTEYVYTDWSPDPTGWFSSEEYDMAEVTSNLTITAFNEVGGWVQETVDTNVFETPLWLRKIINLALENELLEITINPGSRFDNVWRLSATFQWPQDPFEGEVDLSGLPLIGGKYGVSAGFGFGLSLASDRTVTANGSGNFKVTIADYQAGANIGAEATIRIDDAITLEDFVINVQGNIKIPIKQKYKWDVWRFSIGVEVGIDFEADASFSFHIEEAAGEGTFCDGFDWVQTANDIRFTVHPYASASVGIGELRIDGTGVVTFTVHVPEPYFTYPDDLNVEATIKLTLKTFLHTWEWTIIDYSSGSPVEWSVKASGRGWINRTWAKGDYAQYVWTENTTAGNFLENVYSYANPSVAASSETVMMVWTHDDLSKPYIQGYEVYYSLWNPATGVWSPPSPVTDNTIPEDAVSVQFDAWGNAVAVWTQINNSSLSESVDPFSLLNQTELAYAVWNHTTGVWSEPALITNDYVCDYAPLLVGDHDGNLMLTWLVDEDCNSSTLEDLCIYSSTWNGEQWSTPLIVANPGLIASPIQAAYYHGEAVIAWSRHTDGNTTTLSDEEVFYCRFSNSTWSSPIRLTTNDLGDTEPSVAFRYGHPIFTWVQRNATNALVFLDSEGGSPRLVLERPGLSSPRLSVDRQNNTLVIWTDSASETPFSFSITPDGSITFVELLENSSQRNIYCNTLRYQDVVMSMSDNDLIHVVDMDAQTSVSSVTPFKTVVGEGECNQVNVTIANQSYFTSLLNATICINSTAIYECQTVLKGWTSTTITFTWNTTGWEKGNYTISAYTVPVLGETDLADNVKSGWIFVTIPGDVDGDRDIDIFDIVRMASGYGALPPNLKYHPNYDIDGDGDIDIFDLVIAAGHYGDSW